ncbi:MAG: type III pantothenate kinase [Lachnospiraceae bacterium]|nr:type III pantothenate kinase [Lachnospiraceae bacterium]
MLLAIDVGNTNITFGGYEGDRMTCTFRMTTKQQRTSDEYGISISEMLKLSGYTRESVSGVIIASVVPGIMHSLTSSIEKYFNTKPMIVGPGLKTGIKIVTENPKELGADRVVDAVSAYEKYGGPVLVLDFGTATTYDLVNEKGEFCAGITAPGIRISANALTEGTAKLPEIEIKKPESILAQNTVQSMQAGLVYGQIGQTKYIINRVKKEKGYDSLHVVATGGLGSMIAKEVEEISVYDRNLTLDGLSIIYGKNTR